MPTRRMTASLVAGSLLLASCGTSMSSGSDRSGDASGDDGGGADPAGDTAGVGLDLVAELDDADAGAVGQAVNAFGFDLLGEVASGDENTVTSPVSVATLLGMVLAGSGGDTADAIAQVLHLDDARDVRMGALLAQLTDTDDVTFSVANGLWANQGTPFTDSYRSFVQDTFDATVEEADLGAQDTADAIDAWVDENTNGLITDIAQDLGLPNPQAALVLLNAVHFLGEWTTQFDPDDTTDQPFTLPDGKRVDVPLMELRDQDLQHTRRDGYQMLRLPYGDEGRYAMDVLLPDEADGLPALLGSLDADEWQAATDSLAETTVDELALPRFELAWKAELTEALDRLGMGVAFTPAADLRPMSPADPSLDTVVHKTFIRVDEAGTEAAAVSGGVGIISAPADPRVFRVDRPFAFTISDTETDTILFLGSVADPRG